MGGDSDHGATRRSTRDCQPPTGGRLQRSRRGQHRGPPRTDPSEPSPLHFHSIVGRHHPGTGARTTSLTAASHQRTSEAEAEACVCRPATAADADCSAKAEAVVDGKVAHIEAGGGEKQTSHW